MVDFPRWKSLLSIVIIVASLFVVGYDFYNKQVSSTYKGGLKLGLDLQGGSYLVLEADEEVFKTDYLNSVEQYTKAMLDEDNISFSDFINYPDSVSFKLTDPAQYNALRTKLMNFNRNLVVNISSSLVTIKVTKNTYKAQLSSAIEHSMEVVRKRIDQTGTNEPSIRQEGYKKIIVELPGVDDPAEMKRILGTTARLTFHLVDANATFNGTSLKSGYKYVRATDSNIAYAIKIEPEIYGQNLVSASLAFQQNTPVVSFTFDRVGGVKFANITKKNVGNFLAVVMDNKVISAPRINSEITGGSGIITGSFSVAEAQELAILLQAGSLPVPLAVVEERTVGPTLGQSSINAGLISALIGYILVFIYMVVFYRKLGLVANIALIVNTVFILAALDLIGATLTLPGIAGIILTIGMAVDANILVYERFGQELKNSKGSFALLISNSFNRVFITILDSNLTTLFTALFLFGFGSGAIRGFAVTLIIGLLASMFSLMFVSRLLINVFLLNKKNRHKQVGRA